MATAVQARVQLSRDLGDYFASTTTSNGNANGSDLDDDAFADFDADNFFTNERGTTVYITSGSRLDEERRADSDMGFTGGPPVTTLDFTRNFSGQVASGVTYEINRLFTGKAKNEAITEALDLVWPQMFLPKVDDLVMVAQQMDYDVSAAGFYRNIVRQVARVTAGETEQEIRMFQWENQVDEGVGGNKLHFYHQPLSTFTTRIYGHKKMVLADYTDGEDLTILASRAAIYLVKAELARSTVQDRNHLRELLGQVESDFAERLARYKHNPIPFTQTSKTIGSNQNFNTFNV